MSTTALHGPGGRRLARPIRIVDDPLRPASPAIDHSGGRFLVGLLIGLALVGGAVAGWRLVDGWDAGAAPAVAQTERVAVATATPAWPFRPEWLTPRAVR